jgi:hypothetical protein
MASDGKRAWNPHTDLIERFAEAGCAPLDSSSGYFRMCCSSPHHGLGTEYATLWHETIAEAKAEARAAHRPVEVASAIEKFRTAARERRRAAGDPEPDRFGDSKADRSMTAVLYFGKTQPGSPARNEVGLRCWTRDCSSDDMLAGIGISDKRYLYSSAHWTRAETVRPLASPPAVLLRDDREGDAYLKPPDLTLAALAEAKRLPTAFLEQYARDDTNGGVSIFYRTIEGYIGRKKRLWLSGANNFMWLGRRGAGGASHEISAYGELDLFEGRATARFDKGTLVVVEGESDWWTLRYHNIPVLALPGKGTDRTLLPRHLEGVTTVFISRENDGGHGDEFVARVARRLVGLSYDGAARELAMPDGFKDPSDLHIADPEAFSGRFRAALESAAIVDLGAVARAMVEDARLAKSGVARRGSAAAPAAPESDLALRPRNWLTDDGLTLAERGTKVLSAPLDAESDERRPQIEAARGRLIASTVARLGRDVEAIDKTHRGQIAAATEFAHRVLDWAAGQRAGGFWRDMGERPERLIVAAIERSRDLRSFAADASLEVPIVRRALGLAVIEGRPGQVEWAYNLRWSAFERLETHISARAAALPEYADGIRGVGNLVKEVLRREGKAEFWINTRTFEGADFVEHAHSVSREVSDARSAMHQRMSRELAAARTADGVAR